MLNRISTADSYRVIKALEMYFIVDDEEKKLGRYRKGWSDALVARKLGTNINYNHVQRIRTQMFGHIMNAAARAGIAKSRIAGTGSFPADTDHSRLASLERIVLQLTNNTDERLQKLETKTAHAVLVDDNTFSNIVDRLKMLEEALSKLLADLGVAAEVSQSIEDNDDEGMFDAPKS